MLDNFDDVMNKTVELSNTMLEALEYIEQAAAKGEIDEAIAVFDDYVNGLDQTERSLQYILTYVQIDACTEKFKLVCLATQHTLKVFEQKNHSKLPNILKFTLIPSFKKWKQEFQKAKNNFVLN